MLSCLLFSKNAQHHNISSCLWLWCLFTEAVCFIDVTAKKNKKKIFFIHLSMMSNLNIYDTVKIANHSQHRKLIHPWFILV